MFMLVNGIFIMFPFARDIWRFPDDGKSIFSPGSCGIFNYASHTHSTRFTIIIIVFLIIKNKLIRDASH